MTAATALNPTDYCPLETRDLCAAVLTGEREPHELPAWLWDLWRDGFTEGAAQTRATSNREIARLNAEVDYWYVKRKHSPAKIAALRLEASKTGRRIDWDRGVVV
ncbi:hypothetical protein [Microbacterium capsulatum]|uniref:Uncharacterized protein n=1 Tax=Microbacterium capsulatum TaxID=3041921 RepID=A0ABU0XF97_9MICO|nr:hypothetical protein [Microbacterium sp. ASV81]MDQ4213777.1 hypothetical protein [Microbacterium sp. ASV81]